MSSISIHSDSTRKPLINTGKFTLWMFLVSIIMVFVALTSAYLVRRAEGNWLEYELPSYFLWSTIVIVISSVTMHLSYLAIKKDNLNSSKLFITLTTALGFLFLAFQWHACFTQLFDMKVFFGGSQSNAGGSFVYVLVGVHWAHLISGIIYLLIIFSKTLRNKISSKNAVVMDICATYWHFLGVLWIYLYVFLILNH